MFNWLFPPRQQQPAQQPKPEPKSFFSTHDLERVPGQSRLVALMRRVADSLPKITAVGAQDDSSGATTAKMQSQSSQSLPDVLANWYASQSFIGHQLCAILSQHWLINKACTMPARDAIRKEIGRAHV